VKRLWLTTADVVARLKAAHPFSAADPALLATIARSASAKRYAAREAIWEAGAEATVFTVILSGLVEIRRRTPGGEDALLGLFGPRDSIGLSAVLERGGYPASAVAVSSFVDVLEIPAGPVLDALATQSALALATTQALLEHTKALRRKIDVMSSGSVPRRLATLFIDLTERFGERADRVVIIPIAISRTEISELVGARVETVIRILSRWRKDGILSSSRRGFELRDPERLEAILHAND
jgi:CRP-like cAMP-binding protein